MLNCGDEEWSFAGFSVLSGKFRGYHQLCLEYAAQGFIVISVDYRLAPENPYPAGKSWYSCFQTNVNVGVAVLDSYKAMEWVFEQKAEELPKRMDLSNGIILMGDSAGGNLALVLATLARDGLDAELQKITDPDKKMKVFKIVVAYPVLFALSEEDEADSELQSDFVAQVRGNDYLLLSYPIFEGYNSSYLGKDRTKRKELERTDRRVSPILAKLNDLPPILIVSGGDDFLVFHSKALEDKLKETNTPVDHEIYDHQPHGFFSLLYLKAGKEAVKRCIEFLDVAQES